MPIVNGKYVAPIWANDAPPAIDQTELQAISDTIEGMSPGGGSDGKRYARIVIGTSTNGWNPADCDYLCDGVDDQVEINQAIAQITSSPYNKNASIVILDGTYYLSGSISSINGIDIYGTGGTVLKRNTINAGGTYNCLLSFSYSTVSNITFDGNKSLFQGQPQSVCEVAVEGGATLKNCQFQNYVYAGCVLQCVNTVPAGNIRDSFFNSGPVGILVNESQWFNIENNSITASAQIQTVPSVQSSLLKNGRIVNNGDPFGYTGNIILDGLQNSFISGNRCQTIQITNQIGSSGAGSYNIITGNRCTPGVDNQPCIIFGTNTSYNIVSNNNLIFNNNTGIIQDNGTNNIINTSGQITLPTSGWSGNTQTVSATGVTATNIVTTGPAPSSMNAAMQAGVYCSAQGQGTLTFTCSSVPSSSLTYNYTTQGVN